MTSQVGAAAGEGVAVVAMAPSGVTGMPPARENFARASQATRASAPPPTAIRTAPTERAEAPSGPNSCAVPVVPKQIAARRTKRTWRIRPSFHGLGWVGVASRVPRRARLDSTSSTRLTPATLCFRWHAVAFVGAIHGKGRAAVLKRAREHRLATRRSEEHTSELQSRPHLVCRLLLEKKKTST